MNAKITLRQRQTAQLEKCLPGFENVNRYWDTRHNSIVAKILPGEYYVTMEGEAIATTLGSCVSACIWDERGGIGGMNHFMLPFTEQEAKEVNWGQHSDAGNATRYGNYAMEHMINDMLTHGAERKHLRAKVFGGGKVLKQMTNVGQKNVAFVLEYLDDEKIPLLSSDLGDDFPRKVYFEPATGRAKVRKLHHIHNNTLISREKKYQSTILNTPTEGSVELF